MSTLAVLEQTEIPERIEIAGVRMKGSVPVRFHFGGSMQPVVRFGTSMYGTDESTVVVNGVALDVAGFAVHKVRGEWRPDRYNAFRRKGEFGVTAEPPTGAMRKLTEYLVAEAAKLAERFPHAFARPRTETYHNAESYILLAEKMRRVSAIINLVGELHTMVENGKAMLVERTPADPDEIRWEAPSRDILGHGDAFARGRGRVVGTIQVNGFDVGYAVDPSESQYHPDAYHSPLLIPMELVRV